MLLLHPLTQQTTWFCVTERGGFSAEDVNVATLDATGNSTIGGTFGVTGVVTLSGQLNANSGILVDTNKFG